MFLPFLTLPPSPKKPPSPSPNPNGAQYFKKLEVVETKLDECSLKAISKSLSCVTNVTASLSTYTMPTTYTVVMISPIVIMNVSTTLSSSGSPISLSHRTITTPLVLPLLSNPVTDLPNMQTRTSLSLLTFTIGPVCIMCHHLCLCWFPCPLSPFPETRSA